MSGSPKHCQVRLQQEQERKLQEENRKRAALEEARRREEAEQRRRERVAQLQDQTRQNLQTQELRLARFQKTAAGDFVKDRVQALAKRLRQLPAAIGQCQDEAQLTQQQQELRKLADEIEQAIAEGEAAEEAQKAHLAREAAALAAVRRLFQAQDQGRARKFDAEGVKQVQELIAQAESALANKETQKGETLVAQARTRLQQHRTDVQQRFNKWADERWQASASIAKVNDGIVSLKADRTVACWQASALTALDERARRALGLIEAEQFSAAQAEASAMLKEVDEVVAHAQAAQLHEERRNYVVNGIMKVMSEMGFTIQSGTPRLETPADHASATIIHARQLTGETIFVSVPQQGEVWYDIKNYRDAERTRQLDGKVVATCDKAEEQITGFHKVLAERFGIQMGELLWDEKDPLRIKKAEESMRNVNETSEGNSRERSRHR